VHVLCYGITPEDHEWLQAHNDSVEVVRGVPQPIVRSPRPWRIRSSRSRRRSRRVTAGASRSCSRSGRPATAPGQGAETCRPSSTSRRHGGTAIGGTDDHAGIDNRPHLQRRTPRSPRRGCFLAQIPRRQRRRPRLTKGGAAKWTHAAMSLAIRALGDGEEQDRPDPLAVVKIVERVMSEGNVRSGPRRSVTSGRSTRSRCSAPGLRRMNLEVDERRLIQHLQDGDIGHQDLYRRARPDPRARTPPRVVARPPPNGRDRRRADSRTSVAPPPSLRRLRAGDPIRRRDRVPRGARS